MALEDDILKVRAAVGDIEGNPFYPLLADEVYAGFLETYNNDIMQSAKMAAVSISFMVSGWNTRDQIGDLSFSNDFAKNYLGVLKIFLSNPSLVVIPQGIKPWIANSEPSALLELDVFCERKT